MHGVACEFARAVVRSKDAQKQLARMSLRQKSVIFPALLAPDQKLDLTLDPIFDSIPVFRPVS